jgi:RNA polymerase sigma-70 factor (ECF subfamily)
MLDALRGRLLSLDERAAPSEREAELVVRAKRDRQAFVALYDRYLDAIFRYCYLRLGDREAAEDATSQVFAKALDRLPTCRDDAFRSWLFAIAHNVVADHYRRARPVVPLAAAADVLDPQPSPEEMALHDEDGRTVRALLGRLSADQRDVVELRLAGLTGPQIARALGRSHAAVRVAQFRAYARLRALLGDREADDVE